MNESQNTHTPFSKTRAVVLGIISVTCLVVLIVLAGYVVNTFLPKKFFALPSANVETSTASVVVTSVVDGDTINIRIDGKEETVRLLAIDTPETKDPRKAVQCFGREAHDALEKRIAHHEVRLESDPTQADRDKYGRLLRYVYVPDGTNINAEMVASGYAFAYRAFPAEQLATMVALESEARAAQRGLWGTCTVQEKNGMKQTNAVQP